MTNHTEQIFLDKNFESRAVAIYLVSGIKMIGKLIGHDDYTLLISGKNGDHQMIYKHAIATISALQTTHEMHATIR